MIGRQPIFAGKAAGKHGVDRGWNVLDGMRRLWHA